MGTGWLVVVRGNFGLHLLQMDQRMDQRACSKKQNWKRAKLLVVGGASLEVVASNYSSG